MVALKNVADMPIFARSSDSLERVATSVKKIPLKYWRLGILAIALFWICHTLAAHFWYVAPTPELPVPPVKPSVGNAPSAAGASIDVAAVQSLNLFGDFNAEAVAAPVEQEPRLELTKLNLELQGVIAANDPNLSWAIIGQANSQKLYKIGDEVEGARGVEIAEVQALKVILDNNGKLEELWLYGEDGREVASSYTPPPQPQRSAPADAGAKATVSRDQLEQARNIGDVVRFMVATENGKMIGYKVRPGRKRELFDQVGLKADDIVVSVNGIEVNEPQKVREVYQALKDATEADLQVMRDGSTHSIQITMSSEG